MSTPTTSPRTIAVLGATGNQGSGVVRAILAHPELQSYHVRTLTRNPSSASAQRLLTDFQTPNSRLSITAADLHDVESLKAAFDGVYGVFIFTDYRTGKRIEIEKDMEGELIAGRNIVAAAKAVGVEHAVITSLPSIIEASGGKYTKAYHLEHKAQVEELARRELKNVTAVHPSFFFQNFNLPTYCRREADGTICFCAPLPVDKKMEWLDASRDVGIWTAAIFAAGPKKTRSKVYPVFGGIYRLTDFARIFTERTGQKAVCAPLSVDEWAAMVAQKVGKGIEKDMKQSLLWAAEKPNEKVDFGLMDAADDLTERDLGVKGTTFEEWLDRNAWMGPPKF